MSSRRSRDLAPSTIRISFKKKFFAQLETIVGCARTASLRLQRMLLLTHGHVAILTTCAHVAKNKILPF